MARNEQQTPLVHDEGGDCSNSDHGKQPAPRGLRNDDADERPRRPYWAAANNELPNRGGPVFGDSGSAYDAIHVGRGQQNISDLGRFGTFHLLVDHGTTNDRESKQQHQRGAMTEEVDTVSGSKPRPSAGELQRLGHSKFGETPGTEVDQNGQLLSEKASQELLTAAYVKEHQHVVPGQTSTTADAETIKSSTNHGWEEAELTAPTEHPSRRVITMGELEIEFAQLHPFGDKADATINKLLRRWESIRQHTQKETQQSYCDNQRGDSQEKTGPSQTGKRHRHQKGRPEGSRVRHKKREQADEPGSNCDFACPFLLRDLDRWWDTCCRFSNPKPSYVRQHVQIAHVSEPRAAKIPPLKKKKPRRDQWYSIFEFLFPGHEPKPKSPYHNDLILGRFQNFIDRCPNNDISESFLLVSWPNPTASELRQAIINLIERYRVQATTDRDSWISQSISPTGPASGTVSTTPVQTTPDAAYLARIDLFPYSSALDEIATRGPPFTEDTPQLPGGNLPVTSPMFPSTNTTEALTVDPNFNHISEGLDGGEINVLQEQGFSGRERDDMQSQNTPLSPASRSLWDSLFDACVQYDDGVQGMPNNEDAF